MKSYLLLFRGGLPPANSPELIQQHMMKWPKWIEELAKERKFAGGEQLMQKSTVVKGKKKQIIDGPYTESKEVVGGYVIIKAKNEEEATQIAAQCPIFEYDGSVEVREVMIRDN